VYAQTLIEKVLIPVAIAVITYLLFKKHDEYVRRRQYSTLGVAIMESLLEEVKTGISIMGNQRLTPLPVKSWDGVKTVSDDVLLRIIAVSEHIRPVGFPPREIRIHCKNYFEHMSTNWGSAITTGSPQLSGLVGIGHYVEAAEKVKAMLMQCEDLLEENAKRTWPK
jgi:hypothetical protein